MKKVAFSSPSPKKQNKGFKAKLSKVTKTDKNVRKKLKELPIIAVKSNTGHASDSVNGSESKIPFKPKKVKKRNVKGNPEIKTENEETQSVVSTGPISGIVSRMLKKKMKKNASTILKPVTPTDQASGGLSRKQKRKLRLPKTTEEIPEKENITKSQKLGKLLKLHQARKTGKKIKAESESSNMSSNPSKSEKKKLKKLKKLSKVEAEANELSVKSLNKNKKKEFKTAKVSDIQLPAPNLATSAAIVQGVLNKKKSRKQKKLQDAESSNSSIPNALTKKEKVLQESHGSTSAVISVAPLNSKNSVQSRGGKKKKPQKSPENTQLATETISETDSAPLTKGKKKKQKLQFLLKETESEKPVIINDVKNTLYNLKKQRKQVQSIPTLKEKMSDQLKSSRFRWLNEQLYVSDSKEAAKYFKEDPEAFEAYHAGYRKQVSQWPLNPLDWITKSLANSPPGTVIADMGCGEACLADSLPQFKVHSFDLVASKSGVVACDMAHTPLLMGSVDIVVFCLSLMGTNLNDFLLEANRVLKVGGILKIAEVESRFDDVDNFTTELQQLGFQLKKKDYSNQLFYFMDFKKVRNVSKTGKLPVVKLEPCLYKKR